MALSLPRLSLHKQWPFWVNGVLVGAAEIIIYIVLHKPIGLTTGMACEASRSYKPNRDCLRISIRLLMFAFFMNAIVGSYVYGTENGLFGWSYATSFQELMTPANDELTIKYFDRYAHHRGIKGGDEVMDNKSGGVDDRSPVFAGG